MQVGDALFKQYNGDKLIDQLVLRQQHLQQFDWIFPGISEALTHQVDPITAKLIAEERQPTPQGMKAGGNRGGGRQGGSIVDFETAKAKAQGGKQM